MHNTTLQIACLRAKMICRREPVRAAQQLVAAGMPLPSAAAYVVHCRNFNGPAFLAQVLKERA